MPKEKSETKTSRRYCFTFNNPPLDSEGQPILLQHDVGSSKPLFKYLTYQYERGESNTPHFQGFCVLSSPQRFTRIKNLWGAPHLEESQGFDCEARKYCHKVDGRIAGPWEFGDLSSTGQGSRTDLKEACTSLLEHRNIKKLAQDYPDTYVKYHTGFDKLLSTTRDPIPAPNIELLDWQLELIGIFSQVPHDRTIYWYFSALGGAGKSTFTDYLESRYNALVLTSGKHDRLYHQYRGQSMVVFDFSKSQEETLPYAVIETIKNGRRPPGMYGDSGERYSRPHVVVFANTPPSESAFVPGRIILKEIHPIVPPQTQEE